MTDEQITGRRVRAGENDRFGMPTAVGGVVANDGPRWRPKSTIGALGDRIRTARLDLKPDSPEYRAAVVLLLADEIGFNVDRIVLRTRYPRPFVAVCLRRLADNAVWVGGKMQASWNGDAPGCRDFWLDVEVVLGRYLRRIGPDGRPQWAPVGVWVKDFNYTGSSASSESLPNDYYRIEPHNPDPEVAGAEEEVEANEPTSKAGDIGDRQLPTFGFPSPEAADPVAGVGCDEPTGRSGKTESESQLVETWSGADWLI